MKVKNRFTTKRRKYKTPHVELFISYSSVSKLQPLLNHCVTHFEYVGKHWLDPANYSY